MYFEPKKDEELIEIVRKSLFTLFPPFFQSFALSLPAVYFLIYLDIPLLNLGSFVWLVLSVSYIFFNWYVWFFDVYIITDKRIIEVKNRGVFSREITELPLGKIEDLNYKLTGFFSTLFDFGTINLFSTSKMDIIIKNVPDPKRIQNLIRELKRESFVVE